MMGEAQQTFSLNQPTAQTLVSRNLPVSQQFTQAWSDQSPKQSPHPI
jgi:hypothetical protein